jgi:protein phosphatase 1G
MDVYQVEIKVDLSLLSICYLGGLNLSRAIGDHAYKKTSSLPAEEQAITALPDVRTLTLDDQDEFMVIACDGIWNFMSSQDVIDFVRHRLDKKSLSQICEEVRLFLKHISHIFSRQLFMHCLAPNTSGDGTGCDNMTAIIVKFNFNSSSSVSTNNKRPLSPDPISSTETIDNSNNKKLKILTENGTNEPISTEQIPS